jgi:hypothetical protein
MNGKSLDREQRKFRCFFQFPDKEIKVADYGESSSLPELFFVTVGIGKVREQEYLRCLLEQCAYLSYGRRKPLDVQCKYLE